VANQTLFAGAFPTTTISYSGFVMGVRFKADINGQIVGLSYCNFSGAGSAPIGLYDDTGVLLNSGSVTFTNTKAWFTYTLGTPVNITAGTYYRVACLEPANTTLHQSSFGFPLTNGADLTADSTWFVSSGTLVFPTGSGSNNWFGLDVMFAPAGGGSTPPQQPVVVNRAAIFRASTR
jgi:hypothetical protein